MGDRMRLGISACLLGECVRYDGGHKLDRWLRDVLGRRVEYVPLCPEVGCGLGVPREPMQLVGDPDAPRLVVIATGVDRTARMERWISECLAGLEPAGLCGFVFKSRSPSCGPGGVPVERPGGGAPAIGAGLFARAFAGRFPGLPVEDEVRLQDPRVRRLFIERIEARHRLPGARR